MSDRDKPQKIEWAQAMRNGDESRDEADLEMPRPVRPEVARFDYAEVTDLVELAAAPIPKPTLHHLIGPIEIVPGRPGVDEYVNFYTERESRPLRILFQNADGEAMGSVLWDGPGNEPQRLSTWGDQTPPVEPPFVSCRYFSPSAVICADQHASLAENYPYDRAFPAHSKCEHPALKAAGSMMCGHGSFQPGCDYYSPEVVRNLRQVHTEAVVVLAQSARVGQGVRAAQVVKIAEGVRSVIKTTLPTDAERDSRLSALSIMAKEVENLEGPVIEDNVMPERNSFLKGLLAHHAS